MMVAMAKPVSIKAKLAKYEYLIKLQMAKIEELAQENAQLKEGTAHGTLRQIYNDPRTSQANRIRAAQAALACEQPRLMPVQQLELKAQEEPVQDLNELVAERRARQNRLEGTPIEVVPDPGAPYGVRTDLLPKPDANGDDSD
jgi:hypothetical protein